MKKLLCALVFHLFVLSSYSQCFTNVDFNTWQQAGNPANGNWVVQGGGNQVRQTVNGNPSFFITPYDLMNVHITGSFRSTDNDDDFMGFVFSYLNPLGASDTFDCWLYDWKQAQQGGAQSGMSLNRVNGVIPPGMYNTTFWNHQNTPEYTVVDNNFGSAGWNQGTNYTFELFLTYTRAQIYINGNLIFDRQDCYLPGRFGFYNYSQRDCYYSNFNYDPFIDFAYPQQVCQGASAAFNFVNQCVTTPITQYQNLTWNFGDGTVITNNSPSLSNVNVTHTYTTPGTYTVSLTVLDNNGCTSTTSHTVQVNAPIALTPTLVQPLCNGGSNGSVSVNVSGGFGPFQYNWNNGASVQQTYSGIPAGTYVVTVTDGVCVSSAQYTLNQPSPLTATTSHTDANCNLNNGSATIVISGGTPPYQNVTWAGIPGATVTGLGAGTYIANFIDANSCSALLQYTETIQNLPCGINSSLSKVDVACFGANTGSATLTVTGSTPPVNINWSNGSTGATASNLAAGTYTYTFTDANPAHTFSGSVTILGPTAPMNAGLVVSGIACAGSNTGQAIASVTYGGVGPYTYAWSGGLPNNPVASNLGPGPISVTITDSRGCTATANGNISGVPSLTVAMTTGIDSCFNSGNGFAIASVAGGSPPYTYSWSNFKTDSANLNIIPGTYVITVTDLNGCTTQASATVTGPSTPFTYTFTSQNILCNGESTGFVNVNATGGTPGYTYTWNQAGLTGNNQQNLSAGIYGWTITDAFGCSVIGADTLSEPDSALIASVVSTDVTCFGLNNGTITVSVSGGTAPYAYMNNPLPTNPLTLTGLTAGAYNAVVTDANGCSANVTSTINEPGPQSINISVTDNPCFGALQGTASADFVNATGTVNYSWTGGLSGPSLTNLAAGTYIVTATDANNCVLVDSAIINQPAATVMTVTTTDAACFGGNGSATANPSGNSASYTYTWSLAGTPAQQTVNLPAGNYTVSATDASGCQETASFAINEPAGIQVSATATDATCNGSSDGSVQVTIVGGSTGFTFDWSNSVSTTDVANNLQAGSYSVTVTDSNGCSTSTFATVNEPAAISVTATSLGLSCFGLSDGSINAVATGGVNPFTYTASPDGITLLTSATGLFSNVSAGTFTVIATDANSCTATTTVSIGSPDSITTAASSIDITCFGFNDGQLTVTATGGAAPFTYSLGTLTNSTGIFSNLSGGTYTVTVTDNNGCSTNVTNTITEPQPVEILVSPNPVEVTLGESQSIDVSTNQSGPFAYSWLPASGLSCYDCPSPVFSGNNSVTYTVTAVNNNGCAATLSVPVRVVPVYDVFIPNVFSPNNDGANDVWQLYTNVKSIKQYSVMIFNRWGEKVFESSNISEGWDGRYKGEFAPPGVYVYHIQIVWMDNRSDSGYKGSITLLK